MQQRITNIVILFVLALAISTGSSFARKLTTSCDLDHADVRGAQVVYNLSDDEIAGDPVFYSNGTVARACTARIIFDYTTVDGRRDEQGRKLWRIRVDRPDFYGGPFERDAPADSGREPGSFDTLQPGDLVH